MKHTSIQLTIIIAIVFLLVVLCMLYLYSNRGNEKITELSFKSFLVPVFVAFGLLLIEFLKPVVTRNKEFIVSITEDPFTITQLVSGPESSNTYLTDATMQITTFNAKIKENIDELDEKSRIELVELYLLYLINLRYYGSWQAEYNESIPFFEMRSVNKNSGENDVKSKTLKTEGLKKIYRKGHLIQQIDEDITLNIPPNTQLTTNGSEDERELIFENKYITFRIRIKAESIATLPHNDGRTAKTVREKLNLPLDESYRLDFYGFKLTSDISPKRFYKWNPNTYDQIEWAENVIQYIYESYSWDKILNSIELN